MIHKINTLKILGDKIKTSLLPDIDYLARAVQLENGLQNQMLKLL